MTPIQKLKYKKIQKRIIQEHNDVKYIWLFDRFGDHATIAWSSETPSASTHNKAFICWRADGARFYDVQIKFYDLDENDLYDSLVKL